MNFETTQLPIEPSYIAPDGSEIRLLPNVRGGGLSHCTLPAGAVSQAVKHKTVARLSFPPIGRIPALASQAAPTEERPSILSPRTSAAATTAWKSNAASLVP
jgi:hypothetical protein